jgi:hypothetical protein
MVSTETTRRRRRINTTLSRLANNFRRVNIPRNSFNVGTVTSANDRYLSVRLSRKSITELQNVYKKTWEQKVEYAGTIPFTVANTRNYVRFNRPTERTNRQLATVQPTQEDLTQYIVYHTHPVPGYDTPLFTYPSASDFKVYIDNYPTVQANLILENQGYYIIDLIETNMNKPNTADVIRKFNSLMNGQEFQKVRVSWSNLVYIQTTPTQWKKAVNKFIDPIMRREFGISVKYYTWDELGEITLLDRNVLMNIS